jgi:lipopolysaccharide transport system ATP-binding protein
MAIAIKAENISKQYRLGYVGSGTIKDDARRWWAKLRGKEDPLLTVGETNDRSVMGESDYVWALKDINFEIEQGDTVGIIGRNGAGKSTLLKLLSKVTAPTTGNIKVNGRIASLLEVGTGFHGELTGRENIYLNGAIMGMRKHEITRKLDEIVDFAGVERYLDTPVKRYSSGMYVRLGFAVAAHLENEILIVDEVLAVGDAEFQKKCLGKMGDVAKGEGRTVLFVSHNLGAVSTLCKNGILLSNGELKLISNVEKVISKYSLDHQRESTSFYKNKLLINVIKEASIKDNEGNLRNTFKFDETINIHLVCNFKDGITDVLQLGIRLIDQKSRSIFTNQKLINNFYRGKEEINLKVSIPSKLLVPNSYSLIIALHEPNNRVLSLIEDKLGFVIEETGSEFYLYSGKDYGCVFVDCDWTEIIKND